MALLARARPVSSVCAWLDVVNGVCVPCRSLDGTVSCDPQPPRGVRAGASGPDQTSERGLLFQAASADHQHWACRTSCHTCCTRTSLSSWSRCRLHRPRPVAAAGHSSAHLCGRWRAAFSQGNWFGGGLAAADFDLLKLQQQVCVSIRYGDTAAGWHRHRAGSI